MGRDGDHSASQARRVGAAWLWLSLGMVAADRATKFAIEKYTSPFYRHPVISGFLDIVHNQNPGIAFGFFSESNSQMVSHLLLLGAIAMAVLLAWLLLSGRAGGRLAHAGLAMILGGAVGNAFDRAVFGAVTDFIEARAGSFVWPAFNVADSAIVVGAVLVLFELFFDGPRHSHR